jgi:hypothetical protein
MERFYQVCLPETLPYLPVRVKGETPMVNKNLEPPARPPRDRILWPDANIESSQINLQLGLPAAQGQGAASTL